MNLRLMPVLEDLPWESFAWFPPILGLAIRRVLGDDGPKAQERWLEICSRGILRFSFAAREKSSQYIVGVEVGGRMKGVDFQIYGDLSGGNVAVTTSGPSDLSSFKEFRVEPLEQEELKSGEVCLRLTPEEAISLVATILEKWI